MAVKIYHGDILFTPAADRMEIHENSYIIVEDGVVSQICEKIPETYNGVEVVDYGDKLIDHRTSEASKGVRFLSLYKHLFHETFQTSHLPENYAMEHNEKPVQFHFHGDKRSVLYVQQYLSP